MERPIARIPEAETGLEDTDDLDAALGPADQHLTHEPPKD
jgi:hypothetical protein